ncbi:hypothetical protein JB92DRAFT_2997121 [Gautieria morchelliformis]|nr:hypothetical protein JB92DRAFT_2997121 [Gautieria morchelliformis]
MEATSTQRSRGRRLSSTPTGTAVAAITRSDGGSQYVTAQPRTPPIRSPSPVFPTQAQASSLAQKRRSTRRAHAHGRSTGADPMEAAYNTAQPRTPPIKSSSPVFPT